MRWNIRFFEHIEGVDYKLSEEIIDEISFPVDIIESSLRKKFLDIKMLREDFSSSDPNSDERIFFICTK